MHITLVHVLVEPERSADFIAATRRNREGTIAEPGNLRFDVLQSAEDPRRFLLYEVFRSAEDAARHKQTPHYLAWREAVAPWMAAPREGRPYLAVDPADVSQW